MYRKSVLMLLFFLIACGAVFGQTSTIFDNQLLEKAGMSYSWESRISLKANEKISKMWLLDDKVYILTGTNYFYCLNTESGQIQFGRQIASQGLPVYKPEIIDGELMVLAANQIVLMDPNLGTEKAAYDPGFSSINRPVKNDENLLMVGSDDKIYVVRYDDKLKRYSLSADDGSMITSVIATDASAFFGTKTGSVVSFDVGLKRQYWQFNAKDSITADLVYSNGAVYASSRDTKVYKLSAIDGSIIWIFRSGRPLVDSVRIGEKAVYQYTNFKGLYGINDANGEMLWLLSNGVDVLTEKDNKAYVFTSDETIVTMDNNLKKEISSLNATGVKSFVVNSFDGKLYVADGTGRVACINVK